MKNNYLKQTELITDENLKNSLNICDFTDYIQADEFQYIYEHIYNIFQAEAKKYKIDNPIFLFNNYDTLNACAKKKDDFGIIIFNRGFVLISLGEILENEKLKDFNKSFKNIAKYLKISIEELIYQFTYLFTFYHEFAHLLQNCEFELNMTEDNVFLNKEILQSHYKELDADAYSSVHLARHISEYCVKNFEVEILKECIIGITAIFCSNLLYQLMRFPSANKELYFEENSHPHSFIRVLNILAVIGKYINDDLNLTERGIKISKEDLYQPIADEVTRLEDVYQNKNVKNFRESVTTEIEKITAYIKKVSKNKPSKINSAIDVYNSHI